jgi:hypothetical protein
MTRDEALCTQIREALSRDQRIASRPIAVHSNCGIVTLRGCAVSRGSIMAAVEIAASFPACRGVVNRQILARVRETQSHSLWSLPAGDGMLGHSGFACLPGAGIPASVYDSGAIPGQREDSRSLRYAG